MAVMEAMEVTEVTVEADMVEAMVDTVDTDTGMDTTTITMEVIKKQFCFELF